MGLMPGKNLRAKRLVHDRHGLRVSAVGIPESPAGKQWNLQRLKIAGRDIVEIGSDRLARFRSIVKLHLVVQDPFIGQRQSDRGILHSGNPLHGGHAFSQQLAKRSWIVVARVVQRRFGGHHSLGD